MFCFLAAYSGSNVCALLAMPSLNPADFDNLLLIAEICGHSLVFEPNEKPPIVSSQPSKRLSCKLNAGATSSVTTG